MYAIDYPEYQEEAFNFLDVDGEVVEHPEEAYVLGEGHCWKQDEDYDYVIKFKDFVFTSKELYSMAQIMEDNVPRTAKEMIEGVVEDWYEHKKVEPIW